MCCVALSSDRVGIIPEVVRHHLVRFEKHWHGINLSAFQFLLEYTSTIIFIPTPAI